MSDVLQECVHPLDIGRVPELGGLVPDGESPDDPDGAQRDPPEQGKATGGGDGRTGHGERQCGSENAADHADDHDGREAIPAVDPLFGLGEERSALFLLSAGLVGGDGHVRLLISGGANCTHINTY